MIPHPAKRLKPRLIIPTVTQAGAGPDKVVRVACDSEFHGVTTLSIQFAARVYDAIVVKMYRSPLVPLPEAGFNLDALQERIKPWCQRLVLRKIDEITPTLSPVRVLRDLMGLEMFAWSRVRGEEIRDRRHPGKPVTLQLIAHYWPADFFRIFGRRFFAGLVLAQTKRDAGLCLQAHKLLAFRESGKYRHVDPVLEYASEDRLLHPLRVKTFDTRLPFGKASLDALAQSFLDVEKLKAIDKADKEQMLETFRHKTEEAYRYAAWDSVITLLLEEQMREEDRRMYQSFGFSEKEVPPLRSTQGARVAETILKSIAKNTAAGSVALSQRGKLLKDGQVGKVSMSKIKRLLAEGAGERIAVENRSHFGAQTGATHGGLLFSRTPDQFFHAAPGQFRDVDLSGCYGAILGSANMYIGKPVILEPGSKKLTLKEAVALMQEHAAGNDAWFIKVSGKIGRYPNTLIPSTRDALTNSNYKSPAKRKQARHRRWGFTFDWVKENGRSGTGNTVLYTSVIEGGVVAWATWLMIQALPEDWRREYEALEVDTIVFYPAKLVAEDGPGFDHLTEAFSHGGTAWKSKLDMKTLQQVTVEKLDEEYVSLRFPIHELARMITAKRAEAKALEKSAAAQSLKLHVNTMYGVTASRHLVTSNIVLAQVVTATAQALAFAMQTSLNGFQVITDGCTYRRDKIPAGKFGDCLFAATDYPIHRLDECLRFVDPDSIPNDDEAFTGWYQQHVKHFFSVRGKDYDKLFSLHDLVHKRCGDPEQAAFDGLCCDGASNYLKLRQDGEDWEVLEFKARSYSAEAKQNLRDWIVETYSGDNYNGPPPITESTSLLSYKEGRRICRALQETLKKRGKPTRLLFPLGIERRRPQGYKVIKPSAFLFRTPEQQKAITKAMQKFSDTCGCGLEVLALRQTRKDRHQGSLKDVAGLIYTIIQEGGDNLKALNLTRSFEALDEIRKGYFAELGLRRRQLHAELARKIQARNLDEAAMLTGYFVEEGDQILIE